MGNVASSDGDAVARLVSCPQCAAPYRVVGAETRFRCDYCRSLVELRDQVESVELVVTAELPPESEVRRRVRLHLRQLGARGVRVEIERGRYLPFWHLISRGGEEHVVAAAQMDAPFGPGFVLPAAPMDSRDHPLCPEPDPAEPVTVAPEAADGAALATFRDRDPTVATRRLVWIPAVPVTCGAEGWEERGWFLPGPDRLLLSGLPGSVTGPAPDRPRLLAYAGFAALALLLGTWIRDPWARLATEAAVLGVATVVWRVRFGPRSGRTS